MLANTCGISVRVETNTLASVSIRNTTFLMDLRSILTHLEDSLCAFLLDFELSLTLFDQRHALAYNCTQHTHAHTHMSPCDYIAQKHIPRRSTRSRHKIMEMIIRKSKRITVMDNALLMFLCSKCYCRGGGQFFSIVLMFRLIVLMICHSINDFFVVIDVVSFFNITRCWNKSQHIFTAIGKWMNLILSRFGIERSQTHTYKKRCAQFEVHRFALFSIVWVFLVFWNQSNLKPPSLKAKILQIALIDQFWNVNRPDTAIRRPETGKAVYFVFARD